eukprot:s4437_g3.t1
MSRTITITSRIFSISISIVVIVITIVAISTAITTRVMNMKEEHDDHDDDVGYDDDNDDDDDVDDDGDDDDDVDDDDDGHDDDDDIDDDDGDDDADDDDGDRDSGFADGNRLHQICGTRVRSAPHPQLSMKGGPYPQRPPARGRPTEGRQPERELNAFDLEAGQLAPFARLLERRGLAAAGGDPLALRQAWSSVAFQAEGLAKELNAADAASILRGSAAPGLQPAEPLFLQGFL